jgi:hypothetical protein
MTDLDRALLESQAAVAALVAVAERCAGSWSTPRAPGKWSPAQLTEHVARSLDESANVVAGAPSKFPTFPAFLRPLVRRLFFRRILEKGGFPRAKTVRAFDPDSGPASPAEGKARLEAALDRFDSACRARAARGQGVESTLFGNVSVADFARFQEIHIRHHQKQMPAGA